MKTRRRKPEALKPLNKDIYEPTDYALTLIDRVMTREQDMADTAKRRDTERVEEADIYMPDSQLLDTLCGICHTGRNTHWSEVFGKSFDLLQSVRRGSKKFWSKSHRVGLAQNPYTYSKHPNK